MFFQLQLQQLQQKKLNNLIISIVAVCCSCCSKNHRETSNDFMRGGCPGVKVVKVKVVKLVFKTENMTLTSLTLTRMTTLQRYSVTVRNERCALQLKTEGSHLVITPLISMIVD